MRLLNTNTLQLGQYDPGSIPAYAILSHTWGDREVTYQDLAGRDYRPRGSREWEKIHCSCAAASSKGYEYIWIDSCCIDKSSSAELSEAINSMFRWYATADLCIAYLEDTEIPRLQAKRVDSRLVMKNEDLLRRCRWFERGQVESCSIISWRQATAIPELTFVNRWTLQELIAPKEIEFYGANWVSLGTRTTLSTSIEAITGVPDHILQNADSGENTNEIMRILRLERCSVAQRMSWAATRKTTRPEDLAYSLMGLFNINMPLLYGEGGPQAFRRLQEEIIRSTVDESIYSWIEPRSVACHEVHGLLATHPSAFGHDQCRNSMRPHFMSRRERNVTTVTGDGLQLRLLRTPNPLPNTQDIYLVVLACDLGISEQSGQDYASPVLILQRTSSWDDSEFVRIRPEIPLSVWRNKLQLSGRICLPHAFTLALQEPHLLQIYVPHGIPYLQHPRGFLFDQPQSIQLELLGGPWMQISPGIGLELRFGDSPGFQETWKRTVIFGGLKLSRSQNYGGAPSAQCIIVGMSPLPDNQLGTQPLFRDVWASFETCENVMRKRLTNLETQASRLRNNRLASPWKVWLELEGRYSRMYYRIHVSTGE